MEQRKHWWNGKWGRLARRDVFLRADADRWHVEQRAGGAEGISRFYEYDSEEQAYETVRALLADSPGWRELSARPTRGVGLPDWRPGNRLGMQPEIPSSAQPIAQVTDGMRVVDVDGADLGPVVAVAVGDPNAVTAQEPADGEGVLGGSVPHTDRGDEPDVPADVAARLLREGYVKVDGSGPLGRDLYVLADQIARVRDDVVELSVGRSALIPEAH